MNPSINSILEKTFDTERLSLVNLSSENDAPFIFELTTSKGWLNFIGDRNIHSLSDAKNYIDKINDNPNVKYWKVILNEATTNIGLITLIKRDYMDDFDIGFAFLPEYAKKGYAFEGSIAVLEAVVQTVATKQIAAVTQPNNVKSIKLLKKLGLKYDRLIQNSGDNLEIYTISEDKFLIDQLTRMFFSVFTNKEGQTPNWKIIDQVCIPETIIIKKDKLQQEVYNLETFLSPRKKILSDGTLVDFEEKEIKETTTIIGNIAQRITTYKKRGTYNNTPFDQLGNKLFQYIKTTDGWKINSVIWEDQ